MRVLLAIAFALALSVPVLALPVGGHAPTAANPPSAAPRFGHVFVIVLENEGYDSTFGPNGGSPYLAHTLVSQGKLLTQYYGTGHASLDNYVAMVSGQAPTPETSGDCAVYMDFVGTVSPVDGQAVGQGCVYPKEVKTIGDELSAAGLSWRAYAQSMAASPSVAPTACRHQALNSQDTWQGTTPDQYATRHEPFVYFHSIIDDQSSCDQHVVDLELLQGDLANASTTPNFVFITPDVCGDGHDAACANTSRPGGYAGIDGFLREWVPRITSSPAYQDGGLLVVNFDEAGVSDASACCGEQPGPNSPLPGLVGMGGGRTGAVVLSPCVVPRSVDGAAYNHYSLLRTIEDDFGVARLGYSAQQGLADIAAC